ncbi:biosynthetic-type acetolactate synthase large subunit [Pectinatus brassicae]|uniref:Acetolactate synthase n=1 Tax=Pectinatus brassicae TaxID=862415 RepID=A0A840UDF2_9FIRM|nr:biosynthetic-type acetolactate synthase large subunit [Pectinatus brassicae]MBB5335126.1 acetolactate synthase-1/2/3 large subunit [Pectinatus brassicae]
MPINGARAVIESFKQENVNLVFGYPGGAVLTLYDEIYKTKFPHILTKHEQGAVHAADGYARATGKVGVCIATSGPGATNLITGIATANIDSIPLVCITGQVATPFIGRDSFQEADVCGITAPITKHNYLIRNVNDLPRVLKEAFFISRTGRPGPVVIDIAKDVFAAELDFNYPQEVKLRGYSGKYIGNKDDVDTVIEALKQSQKPLIFVGGGVVSANMHEAFREIVENLQIPVTSTLMGLGCADPEDEKTLGMAGMHGSYASNMAIMQCDLLLGIGVRFDDRVTGIMSEFSPHAKIVQFDIDYAEVNKNVTSHISVIGDLKWSLPLLLEKIRPITEQIKTAAANWTRYIIDMHKNNPFTYKNSAEMILAQEAIAAVAKIAPRDSIAATDVGQHQMWAAQFFPVNMPRHFITSGGLGTMGYGLPAAMGAKIACPDKPVILFTGDGSIMMNCQELATLADYNVDIKIIVIHNHVLGMVTQWQRMFYGERYSQSLLNSKADIVKIAEAMGIKACRIDKKADLQNKLQDALSHKGPILIDIIVPEVEDVLPMVPGGKRLDQMVREGDV